jgi:hypothetical protein
LCCVLKEERREIVLKRDVSFTLRIHSLFFSNNTTSCTTLNCCVGIGGCWCFRFVSLVSNNSHYHSRCFLRQLAGSCSARAAHVMACASSRSSWHRRDDRGAVSPLSPRHTHPQRNAWHARPAASQTLCATGTAGALLACFCLFALFALRV